MRSELQNIIGLVHKLDDAAWEAGCNIGAEGDSDRKAANESAREKAKNDLIQALTIALPPDEVKVPVNPSKEQNIEVRVRQIVVDHYGIMFDFSSKFADLGDDLDFVELVLALEDEFSLEIPDEDEKMLWKKTVADVIRYVMLACNHAQKNSGLPQSKALKPNEIMIRGVTPGHKISALKSIRYVTGMGLSETKRFLDLLDKTKMPRVITMDSKQHDLADLAHCLAVLKEDGVIL